MQVSRSTYYQYLEPMEQGAEKQKVEQQVIEVFHEHRRRYGSRRICAVLKEKQVRISKYKCRRVMQRHGLSAFEPRSFVPRTTQSRHPYPISPNLLLDRSSPVKPNEVWVGTSLICRTQKASGPICRCGWTCIPDASWAGWWSGTCAKNW